MAFRTKNPLFKKKKEEDVFKELEAKAQRCLETGKGC